VVAKERSLTNAMLALSHQQLNQYHEDGYLVVRSLFEYEIAAFAARRCEVDPRFRDGFAVWSYPGSDIFGMLSRSASLITMMEQLLGGEVYHYQGKVMSKTHRNGGRFEWHQDYGYWYRFGLPYPLLASCMVSFNGASKENGCLQVLRSSHHMGRLDHIEIGGGNLAAEHQRLEWALRTFEHIYIEMNPGDGLLFHCNLLHGSAPNTSCRPRWTLISCYNAARNNPYLDYQTTLHPCYTPLGKVSDASILEWSREQVRNLDTAAAT
jgi:ectoine hydroxylase